MSLRMSIPPLQEPINLVEAKDHLRIDGVTEDNLLNRQIVACRIYLEEALIRRSLIFRTYEYYLHAFPLGDEIKLPMPPLVEVLEFKYYKADGTDDDVDPATFLVDEISEPAKIVLKSSATWPSASLQEVNAVKITFLAGYGPDGSDVPETFRQALLLLLGHWYENRETVMIGEVPRELPLGLESLIWSDRVF